jgi:hypothetical protein
MLAALATAAISAASKSSQGQAAPAMSQAYGSTVNVGGLSVNKQSATSLAAAAVLGAGLVWLLVRK